MKKLFSLFAFSFLALALVPFFVDAAPTLTETLDAVKNKYTFSDRINAVVTDGETLYLGGSFTNVWQSIGEAGVFDLTGGDFTDFPKIETHEDPATVYAVVSDGVGGWYVGGSFDRVDNAETNPLIHVLFDGRVDTDFNPEFTPGDTIYTLVLSPDGETLYVGGSFTVGSEGNLVALDASTGDVSSVAFDFIATCNDTVFALELSSDGGLLYVGGDCMEVSGIGQTSLAAFNTLDGTATAFDPGVTATVRALALSSDDATLYAGGDFTTVNGATTRNSLAAFDATTGITTAFDPNINGSVVALALSSDDATLYAGGDFTTVNGATTRSALAAFTTSNGIVTDFDPNADNVVTSLALSVDGMTLYAGGDFATVNGVTSRRRLAAFDATTGTATEEDFAEGVSAGVNAIALSGTDLFFGGGNMNIHSVSRGEVAAIDLATYELTDFNPNMVSGDNSVYSLALSPDASTLYIGGDFHGINGVGNIRYRLAAVTTSDGIMTAFDPDVSGIVRALDVSSDGTTVYAGGEFTCVNGGLDESDVCLGTERTYAAAFSSSDSTVTGFAPELNSTVFTLMLSPDETQVYVGGDFTEKLLAVDATDGSSLLSIEFPADDTVRALALSLDGETLYAGGDFTEFAPGITGIGEGGVFDATTGSFVDSQSVLSTGDGLTVNTSIPDGNGGWYVGGSFNQVDAVAWDARIVHILSDMTIDPAFEPDFGVSGGRVSALALSSDGETLYAGGEFTSINATTRNYLAALDTSDGSLTAFDPNMNGVVSALQLSSDGTTLYATGDFLVVNGATGRGHVAGLNTLDGIATAFNPSLDNGATSLALSSDDLVLYVGGDFSCVEYDSGLEVCNASRNYLAALDTTQTTSVATAFNPNMSGAVHSLELSGDGNTLFVGGDFFCVGGLDIEGQCLGDSRSNLAAIDTSDSLAMPFAPDPDSLVYALSLSSDESVLYVGGDFSVISGQNIAGLAALNTSDATLTEFNALLDDSGGVGIYTISDPVNGNIFAGGVSTFILGTGGGARGGLAAFSTFNLHLLDFNPDFADNGSVYSLALTSDNEILYVGGTFSSGGETSRQYLAAIQTSNASVLDFDPADDYDAFALALHPDDGELYAAGQSGWFGIYDSEEVEEEDDGTSGGRSSKRQDPPATLVGSDTSAPTNPSQSLLTLLRDLIQQFITAGGTPTPAMLAFLNGPTTTTGGYTRDLTLESQGSDVTKLQLFLITQNKGPQALTLGAVGATGFFGPLTQSALAEYQASVGITPASGYFGPVTRAYLISIGAW